MPLVTENGVVTFTDKFIKESRRRKYWRLSYTCYGPDYVRGEDGEEVAILRKHERQSEEYRESVLPSSVEARVSIEAGTPMGWERYVGTKGSAIGVPHFGASASADVLYEEFGLTAQRVIDEANRILG